MLDKVESELEDCDGDDDDDVSVGVEVDVVGGSMLSAMYSTNLVIVLRDLMVVS